MKKRIVLLSLLALAAFAAPTLAGPLGWTPWAVGSGSTTVSPSGDVTFHAGLSTAPVWAGPPLQYGNKAFYSTGLYNGATVGFLDELWYKCVAGECVTLPNTLKGPYLHIYVQDATGGKGMLLLDATPAVPGDLDGQAYHKFSTANYRLGEAIGTLAASSLNDGVFHPFADVQGLVIAPGVYAGMVEPIGGWGSAPADGLQLGWGNRAGAPEYWTDVTINDLNVTPPVPEPASMTLLGLGLAGAFVAVRKRRQ